MLTKKRIPWNKGLKGAQTAWNKGMVGFSHSGSFKKGHTDLVPATSRRVAGEKMLGPKHHAWKGSAAGYYALHSWLRRRYGRPSECENCKKPEDISGKTTLIEWSNVSGQYRRERADWRALCKACHRKFDEHPFFLPRTNEQRAHLSRKMEGKNNPMYGMKHSEEAKRKMSKTKTKKP